MIHTSERTRSGWCVVSAAGRADAVSADDLEAALRSALERHPRVAAELKHLDYISSAGLRAVLQAARFAQDRRAEFAVCSLSPPVKRVFEMSGMHHFLTVREELPC
jgi:anti-sigma B factor antagonist